MVNGHFVYGSEIKSILEFPGFEKKLNLDTLNNYLSFQYAVPPQTFFEGLYCLPPAHFLRFKDGKVETKRYWEPKFTPDENMKEEDAVNAIDKVFEESINLHKTSSDVEVGCFCPPAWIRAMVSTYFLGQKTFTVGFDYGDKYNEIAGRKSFGKN